MQWGRLAYRIMALAVIALGVNSFVQPLPPPQPIGPLYLITVLPLGIFLGWAIYRYQRSRLTVDLASVLLLIGGFLVVATRAFPHRVTDVIGFGLAAVGLILAAWAMGHLPHPSKP
jgi:peptidoglycan/LPS O-acetylase OafA/YrhL